MVDGAVSEETLPAPSAAEHRGWSRKMILWSAALAAFLLLAAWGAANWRVFHLVYCRHLMASKDDEAQSKAIDLILQYHLRKGMTVEQVRAVLRPTELKHGEEGWYSRNQLWEEQGYCLMFEFDSAGRLEHWYTYP